MNVKPDARRRSHGGTTNAADPQAGPAPRSRQVNRSRRRLLQAAGTAATLVLVDCASSQGTKPAGGHSAAGGDEEVSPGEDLMREHGLLARILLIYEEAQRRLAGRGRPPFDVLDRSASLVRRFIEDYHERLEEEFLFPRFEAAGLETGLVEVLRAQHAGGRSLTDSIIELVRDKSAHQPAGRDRLAGCLRSFVRMYRPHAAREDTVLFPALRDILGGDAAYQELGERFEAREHAAFGESGFTQVVHQVADLERAIGIHDLARFTPRGAAGTAGIAGSGSGI